MDGVSGACWLEVSLHQELGIKNWVVARCPLGHFDRRKWV
jgi:hypothetical protein